MPSKPSYPGRIGAQFISRYSALGAAALTN
jgi:hypothetical protein